MSPLTVGLLETTPGLYGLFPATSFRPAKPMGPSAWLIDRRLLLLVFRR